MKKTIHLIVLSLIFSLMTINLAFAKEWTWGNAPGHHGDSILLDKSVKSATDIINRYGRGELLAEAAVEIVDKENGEIFINISTLAHRNVDYIRHTVALEQWDEKRNDWIQVDYLFFDRTKEDEADGELAYLMNSITVSGFPVNKYYRVCGLHMVELGESSEGCATETNGVYITNK